MTPKTPTERQLRDAVLALAREFPFARTLVNSGRLSRPCSLAGLSSIVADDAAVAGSMAPGTACADAPLARTDGGPTWLLESIGGDFTVLTFAASAAELGRLEGEQRAAGLALPLRVLVPAGAIDRASAGLKGRATLLLDAQGLAHERYDGEPGVTYLIRPDQHVGARFGRFDAPRVAATYARSLSCPL